MSAGPDDAPPFAKDAPNETEPSSRCDFALISEIGDCAVAEIIIGKRRRALDPVKVDELAASIRRVGLRHSITVTPEGDIEAAFRHRKKVCANAMQLVAGLHRLEAVKKLGWRTIPVNVIPHGYQLHCKLWEIDENLVRAELTELERGEHLADRKAIYEQLHPETKAGAAQALGMNQALGNDVGDNLAPTFTADTAAKTGRSQRSIERAVHRAENIAPDVRDEIRDVPEISDSGVELDALAKVAPAEQAAAVDAVKSGQTKTVREAISYGPKRAPISPEPAPLPRSKVLGTIGSPREQWIAATANTYKAPAPSLYDVFMDTARLMGDAKHRDEISRPKRKQLAHAFLVALDMSLSDLAPDLDATIDPEITDLGKISPLTGA